MRENSFGNILLYILMVFLCVGLVILIFFNYRANAEQKQQLEAEAAAAEATPTPAPAVTPEPTEAPVRNTETVTLAFAGDIVAQSGLTTAAQSVDGDTVRYDYSDELAGVTELLQQADYSSCTYVGTIRDGEDYNNYEMAPDIAAALSVTGFQLVNTATDHILDNGIDGLAETDDVLSAEGLAVVGTHADEDDTDVFVQTINGVNVAFLSYTYGTGGVSVSDTPWAVDIFTTDYMTDQKSYDKDRITADIAAAKEEGADIIVCYVYWWDDTQYYTQVRDKQQDLAEYLCQSGVDVLIGSGIKMPQPIETLTVERSDGTSANCVICYSLSNLMSCFTDENTNLSAVAMVDISRDVDNGDVWVSGVSYTPLFMMDTRNYPAVDEPEEDELSEEEAEETTEEESEEETGEEELTRVEYTLSVLNAYAEVSDYEQDNSSLTNTAYNAVCAGIERLQELLGAQYDTANGGVTLDYPE